MPGETAPEPARRHGDRPEGNTRSAHGGAPTGRTNGVKPPGTARPTTGATNGVKPPTGPAAAGPATAKAAATKTPVAKAPVAGADTSS
ncbi:hypothetical protein B4N89_32750 [Embleya scabrispora]|uniref:Uncharacterized protein n=1 Tax=Embleya scabrispora TaxID=159449 RepID=A0A1T3NQ51_9ACTN|nr:hypothetical protein B4N89_32750 [Embleya scabrispora]